MAFKRAPSWALLWCWLLNTRLALALSVFASASPAHGRVAKRTLPGSHRTPPTPAQRRRQTALRPEAGDQALPGLAKRAHEWSRAVADDIAAWRAQLESLEIPTVRLPIVEPPLTAVGAPARTSCIQLPPADFDMPLAIRCAELSRISYQMRDDRSPDEAQVDAQVAALGMRVMSHFYDARQDVYAFLAKDSNEDGSLYLIFRGTSTDKNVLTDLDYLPTDYVAPERRGGGGAFDVGGGAGGALADFLQLHRPLELDADTYVHRGFLAAWTALRAPVMAALDSHLAHSTRAPWAWVAPGWLAGRRPPALHVAGHSMGGAIGMLASLETSRRFRRRGPLAPRGTHTTYTFACPRVGNAAFASAYSEAFPNARDHWAVQVAEDAVPHLPLAAWGFCHPEGAVVLGDEAGGEEPISARHVADPGDVPGDYWPKEGRLKNWATFHVVEAYLERLGTVAGAAAAA